jgi:hypothetical protein
MTAQEVEAGKMLADKMGAAGNLLKALDEYLAAQDAGGQQATPAPSLGNQG